MSCWIAGTALALLYVSARATAVIERDEGIAAFTQARSLTEPSQPAADIAAGRAPDQSRWSEGRRQRYAAQIAEPALPPSIPEAVLRIRSIRLEVPVYADSNERNLNRGAVLVAGTASLDSDGNIAIAAHRDGFFRALKDVAIGNLVEVASRSGRRLYRVAEPMVVEPTDTRPLRGIDQPAVTLVTCYPFYFVGSAPQRFIVRAVAVG